MSLKSIGIVVFVIGLLMLVYTGFTFVTTEKVVDIGPIEVNAEKNHFVQWPPILGAVLLITGFVMMTKRNSGSENLNP